MVKQKNKIEILHDLGFKWIDNGKGISVCIPEQLDSNNWTICVENGLTIEGKKKPFMVFDCSFDYVIQVINNNVANFL